MTIKNFLKFITDPEKDIRERLFLLLTSMAILALFCTVITGIFEGVDPKEQYVLLGSMLLAAVVTAVSLRHHTVPVGALILSIGLTFFILPAAFVFGGGVWGGSVIWYAFAYLYIGLILEGITRIVMIAMLTLTVILEYMADYYSLIPIVRYPVKLSYVDSLVSIIVVGIMIFTMVLFQTSVYVLENEISKKQKKEIEELNRAQSRFFSSMSHEIRTPINTIIGLNEMILRENISDEVAEDARNIQASSKMLLQIINDILDMSKIESGQMEIVKAAYDPGEMLSEIVGMLWIRAKDKGLSFHIEVDPALPVSLYGDEVRIKQVLINLITNAIKYTKEGSVTLSIGCKKEGPGKVLVTYTVADTGMGIRKESIPHLFSAFKRVDTEQNRFIEGTGLGLSIVKQFVDLMGGVITVNSVYTKGSTFVVELPQEVADENAIGELNLETRHSMNLQEHYLQSFEAPDARILVVDDNDANLMVAGKLLRDTKVQVDTALSGAEALTKTLTNQYDLILMDHLMPEMDGVECFHAIRDQSGGRNNDTPVTILTANAGSENQSFYANQGFSGYLLKPVTGETLERELLRLLPRELIQVTARGEEMMGESFNPINMYQKKVPVIITSDSVCDLPKDMAKRRGIPIQPYQIFTDEGVFLDSVEAESRVVLSYMQDAGKTVRSDAPDLASYERFFAEQLLKAHHVIHITMTSKVSRGYEIALEAAQTFDNVSVIDSGHLSSGMGHMVLAANRMAAEGKSAGDIVREVEKLRPLIHTSFVVENTEYLARSGRLPGKIDRLCNALMIHPVLVLKKGKLTVGRVFVGSRKRVWDKYIKSALDVTGEIDNELLFVTYAGLSFEEQDEIRAMIEEQFHFQEIIFQQASPAISTNCGPGTFGLLFRVRG